MFGSRGLRKAEGAVVDGLSLLSHKGKMIDNNNIK